MINPRPWDKEDAVNAVITVLRVGPGTFSEIKERIDKCAVVMNYGNPRNEISHETLSGILRRLTFLCYQGSGIVNHNGKLYELAHPELFIRQQTWCGDTLIADQVNHEDGLISQDISMDRKGEVVGHFNEIFRFASEVLRREQTKKMEEESKLRT
jgi:hypothetical protein